jgi:hypothetical protein
MLLGANRVGFGTLAMIAVGCTTCRGCHLDTCHVGYRHPDRLAGRSRTKKGCAALFRASLTMAVDGPEKLVYPVWRGSAPHHRRARLQPYAGSGRPLRPPGPNPSAGANQPVGAAGRPSAVHAGGSRRAGGRSGGARAGHRRCCRRFGEPLLQPGSTHPGDVCRDFVQ